MLSNSMDRELDCQAMLEERLKKQTKLATKKGKKSANKFDMGDKVVIHRQQKVVRHS